LGGAARSAAAGHSSHRTTCLRTASGRNWFTSSTSTLVER
jgi:hypothetical protein